MVMVAQAGSWFARLVVVLDEFAPNGGAFAQAVAWGTRLRLPLYAVWPLEDLNLPLVRACAEVCARRALPWEMASWVSSPARGWGELLRSGDLCLVSSLSRTVQDKGVLRHLAACCEPAVLVCPQKPAPVGRVLILCQGDHPSEGFLAGTLHLTQQLGARPVVLTVARSERVAQLRQQAARELLAEDGLTADFDLLVGAEVRTAVAAVARWRGCQLVMVERHAAPPWWRWLRGNTADRLLDLGDSLGILALPVVRERAVPGRAPDGPTAGLAKPPVRSV